MEDFNYSWEELISIVADVAAAYTGLEHSSVSYEKAQMLMGAVIYCIKECSTQNNPALLAGALSAKEAYTYGRQIVTAKVKELRGIYNKLIMDFESYGLECLEDVMVKGVPRFLVKYDVVYAPQETLLTLDYPVLKDVSGSGIDAVLEYVKCVTVEQHFLQKFDERYIREILRAYAGEYESLLENICGIVLPNFLGYIILDKPLDTGGFEKADLEELEDILWKISDNERKDYLTGILKIFIEHSYENAALIMDYFIKAMPNLVTRINGNLQNHCLNKIFLERF